MMAISQLLGLIINVFFLIAGFIIIDKVPFFITNLNEKKIKGKHFAKLGLICFFGIRSFAEFIMGVINLSIFSFSGVVGCCGILLLIYSAILFYQGAKFSSNENNNSVKEKVKKPVFIANEEISQRAQYAYTKFKNEYDQGAMLFDEIAEAKMFAKAVELQLLKAPASAVFCSMEEMSVIPIGDGAYSVSGYVDSQNSYGAMLRNQFNLTVFKDESGIWKNANRFVSTAASVNSKIISSTILYWVFGIIATIIIFAISYAFTSSMI